MPRCCSTVRAGPAARARRARPCIVVPYPRRRRVESMLRDARIEAEWIDAPTPEAIRAQDRGRLLANLLEAVEFDDEDRELASLLMAERSPEDIAAALVHAHRAAMPQAGGTDRRTRPQRAKPRRRNATGRASKTPSGSG